MSKTNSPLYRRRQARGLSMEDAYAISEAGRDRVTETIGQEIGAVGSALQEALEKGRKAKGERDAKAKEAAEKAQLAQDTKSALDAFETDQYLDDVLDLEHGDELDAILGTTDKKEVVEAVSSTETSAEDIEKSKDRVYTDEMAWANLTPDQKAQKAKEGITSFADFTAAASEWRTKNKGYINIATEGNKRDTQKSTAWKSPFERRRATNRFRREADSIYGTGSMSVGSSDSSQYQKGKTFVEKEYRLPGASFMGNAAIEGYNMAVDKRNYERQVEADMLDYVNEATKGLDVPATGISILDRSLSEAAVEMKKKFFNHQKERSQWAAEGRLAEWNTQNDQYKNFSTETKGLLDGLRAGITEIGEKVKSGEIDRNASAPEGFSLFTSLMSGNAEIGIVNTENGPTLMGATAHGDPVNIMARSIQDTLRGLQFIPKQEPMEFYNDFMTRLKDNKIFGVEKQATVMPNGNEVMAYNTKGLENALNVYIKEELKDPNDLRGYASALLGWSYGQYDAVVDSGGDPRKIVADKMRQDMDGMLSNVKGYKSEETTGLSTALANEQIKIRKEQRGKDSTDASDRGKAENAAFQQVGDFFKDKSVWIRENIGVIGEGGVDYDGTRNLTIESDDGPISYDLNRKEDIVALIRDYGKKAGGQGGADFDIYVKNFVEARRSERKSKASNAIDQYNKFLIESN